MCFLVFIYWVRVVASNFKLKRIADGEEFILSERSLLVGRSDSCDIQVKQGHPSREHARVAERDGGVLVQDLHSTNGTFVNNKRIEVATLTHIGDVVKFGDEAFSVQSIGAPEATVLMRSLGSNAGVSASVIDDDDEDEPDADATSILELYSLPPGWDDAASGFQSTVGKLDERKREAIDRYVEKFSKTLKGKSGLFLIFFSDEDLPVFKSLIVAEGKLSWTLGRDSTCDVVYENPCISKYHANIVREAGGWFLEDVGSTNGVTLGGTRQKKIQLRDGMVLEISAVEVLIRYIS